MKFEDIYKEYYHDVYCFLLSMSRSPQVADELTQETFYRALKYVHKFRGESSIKTWLCKIAKNTYLSYVKKQKFYSEDEFDYEKMSAYEMKHNNETAGTEELYLRKEQSLSIYKILHSMEEPYKEVFILRVIAEMSFSEIGEIFGRKEGWARVTYHRAKLKIRELIKEVP